MKYFLLSLCLSGVLLAFFPAPVRACDVCGCSVGGSYLGILPQFSRNFAGLKYKYRSFGFAGVLPAHEGEVMPLEDQFQTWEAWGRFHLGKKWQLFAFVPVSQNLRVLESGNTRLRGIGDASLMAYYSLLNTGDSAKHVWKHNLMAGGGVKMPTGKYQQRNADYELLPQAFQLGSGAYSFSANVNYTVRYKKMGLNTEFQYRKSSYNELQYRFGDQISAAATFFYWKNVRRFTFLPNVGLFAEKIGQDFQYKVHVAETGSTNLYATAGVETYYKRLALGLSVQQPLKQQVSEYQPRSRSRLSANVSVLF
ncbi:MAG: hypothetical protein EAZ89_17400 [Bacteroidetes bacterium]|nr:MAG: hypothetical protein EAZ89_17400 [Bacteroidota bacterium]